jgi:hypothetical protein
MGLQVGLASKAFLARRGVVLHHGALERTRAGVNSLVTEKQQHEAKQSKTVELLNFEKRRRTS